VIGCRKGWCGGCHPAAVENGNDVVNIPDLGTEVFVGSMGNIMIALHIGSSRFSDQLKILLKTITILKLGFS
jgi:hypothetical protein